MPFWIVPTTVLLCSATALGAGEDLARGSYPLGNWEVLSSRFRSQGASARLAPLYTRAGTRAIWLARLAFSVISIALALFRLHNFLAVALVLLGLTIALERLRTPFGHDGAGGVQMITAGYLSLALFAGTPSAYKAVQVALLAQLVVAYTVSGIAKLVSPEWRSGEAICTIAALPQYGLWIDRDVGPRLGLVVAWFTIVGEVSFVLTVACGWVGFALIVFGLALHVGAAVFMGLNTFLLSFVAWYPPLIAHCGVL